MSSQEQPDTLAPESVVGKRYKIIRLLGKGGMGAVYEAENTWLKHRVALKVMSGAIANAQGGQYVRRFMQEAQTAAALQHPNIVRVLDMGQDEETSALFIVQELLSGHDLAWRLKQAGGKVAVREAIELIAPVMDALVVAHERGVVHRDLKPDNIFLSETPRGVVPTLIDFGIAKVRTDGEVLQRTHTGMLMGTPYYMSPEQARGDTSLDARSDVWSLGVVLYQALSGALPHRAANAGALIAKIIYQPPTPFATSAPDLPTALADLVMRAVEPDLEKRFPSMRAFLEALRDFASSAGVELSVPPVTTTAPATSHAAKNEAPAFAKTMAVKDHETLEPVSSAPPPPRNRRNATIAVAAALTLTGVLVTASMRSKGPHGDAPQLPASTAPATNAHTAVAPPVVQAPAPTEQAPVPSVQAPPVVAPALTAPVAVARPATHDAGVAMSAHAPLQPRPARAATHDAGAAPPATTPTTPQTTARPALPSVE